MNMFRFSNLFAGTSTSANTSPSKKSAQSQQQPINVWYGSQNNSMQRRSTGNINTPSKYTGETGFEGWVGFILVTFLFYNTVIPNYDLAIVGYYCFDLADVKKIVSKV